MQWLILVLWSAAGAIWIHGRRFTLLRLSMALGLAASMGMQICLLWLDGLLTIETGLPLHLCGLFGLLSIPLLFFPHGPLWEACAFLGAPAAASALFFPAVIPCSHPLLMKWAFCQLHVLIALCPAVIFFTGKPLPTHSKRTFLLGSGYLAFVDAFNRSFQTNYLFLHTAPAGTPLQWLLARGTPAYVCSLLLIFAAVFSCLEGLYCRANERLPPPALTEGNSSAYSPCSRRRTPCTSRGRG